MPRPETKQGTWMLLILALLFILVLDVLFSPRWDTNDDIAMSMMLHGYGIFMSPTTQLLYSNVLWGKLLQCLPSPFGLPGYSLATLLVLAIITLALVYCLVNLGLGQVQCASLLALLMIRPILFPQFTINAGLLMLDAILCWFVYARDYRWGWLLAGCLLAWLAAMIRVMECMLVLVAAAPIFPWKKFLSRGHAQVAFAILALVIALANFYDYLSYHQSPAWQTYNQYNPLLVLFRDFRVGYRMEEYPGILQEHHYTANDIHLLNHWFFVDSKIMNPDALRAMLSALDLKPYSYSMAWGYSKTAIRAIWDPRVQLLFAVAFVLMLLRPTWRSLAGWCIVLASIVLLGFLGRPGMLRVYIPLASLLVLIPVLTGVGTTLSWRHNVAIAILLCAAVVNGIIVCRDSRALQVQDSYYRDGLLRYEGDSVVIWGNSFPYEAVYPVIDTQQKFRKLHIYSLGAVTYAPGTVSYTEAVTGRDFVSRLLSSDGVAMIAKDEYYDYLAIYCREHHQGDLRELSLTHYGPVVVSRRQCQTGSQ